MKLWFENRYGDQRVIAECKTSEEVFTAINAFIRTCNKNRSAPFISHYIRSWTEGEKTWYDVGSHSEFFFTTEK